MPPRSARALFEIAREREANPNSLSQTRMRDTDKFPRKRLGITEGDLMLLKKTRLDARAWEGEGSTRGSLVNLVDAMSVSGHLIPLPHKLQCSG
jgi:hypothetical protein